MTEFKINIPFVKIQNEDSNNSLRDQMINDSESSISLSKSVEKNDKDKPEDLSNQHGLFSEHDSRWCRPCPNAGIVAIPVIVTLVVLISVGIYFYHCSINDLPHNNSQYSNPFLESSTNTTTELETSAKKSPLNRDNIPSDCLLMIEPGNCKGNFKSYAFSEDIWSCKMFVYSGCKGNGNRFNSLKECENKCY